METVREGSTAEVRILGRTFAFKSDSDDGFMRETVELVNTRMRELIEKSGTLSAEKIAILAAMNFAGELLRRRKEEASQREWVRQKTRKLLDLIDAQL